MADEHREVQDLLAEYLSGDLAQDRLEAVKAHLQECEECSEFVRRSQLILASLRASADWEKDQHPSEELLVLFAENPQRVERTLREKVETHLLLCAQCSHELALLGSMDELTSPTSALWPQDETRTRGFWSIVGQTIRRPALAYTLIVVVLILSYPAFRYMSEPAWQDHPAIDGMTVSGIVRLTERMRTTSSLPIVRLDNRSEVIRLSLSFWPQTGREYSILIQGPDGESLKRKALTDQEVQQGDIYLEVPSALLKGGEYAVILEGVQSADLGDTLTTDFPFRVEPGR